MGCFNTQPPEGGWFIFLIIMAISPSFNTQPPEGGWACLLIVRPIERCFNTQPPEGGWQYGICRLPHQIVSTHSRPKAAGLFGNVLNKTDRFQHTAARRRLEIQTVTVKLRNMFQHTAARRRLVERKQGIYL